jgi:hypothetical protein
MPRNKTFMPLAAALTALLVFACNLPSSAKPIATSPGAAAPSQTAAPPDTDTPSASLSPTAPPSATGPITPTPQNPIVTITAYCWSGPNTKTYSYEVISSIPAGTRVQLLGQGIIQGWWIVRNPRYGDPCWIQSAYIQIDPGYDVSGLKVYPVPPTPTATP